MSIPVNAEETYYTDDQKYNYTSTSSTETEIYGGTKFIEEKGYSMRGQTKSDQEVFLLSQKSDASKGMKVVTWAIYNSESELSNLAFSRAPLGKIAEDYEKNHPGWKVLGGINADQYFFKYGKKLGVDGSDLFMNQPYYPMISDGENWFTNNATGINSNVVGFKNDGSTEPLVYGQRERTGLKLSIYNEQHEVIQKFDVDDLNPKTPISNNQTVIHALYNTDYDATNSSNATKSQLCESTHSLYIIEKADKAYVSNSKEWQWENKNGVDAFFGKGEITSIKNQHELTMHQFAIETTNPTVEKYLKVGTYVMAQYEFDEAMENCDEAIGFHTVQRLNNQDQNVSNSYNTRGYPRSIFGCTDDGTIVLMAGNGGVGGQNKGLYAQEANALCKKYHIVNAFQMDGGGSVTMVVRSSNGSFKTVTTGTDGGDRSVLSGLFFVVRDIDATVTREEIEEDALHLNISIQDSVGKNISHVYMELKGKDNQGNDQTWVQEVINQNVEFTSLLHHSTYEYCILIQEEGSTVKQRTLQAGSLSTGRLIPKIIEGTITYQNDTWIIQCKIQDDDNALYGYPLVSFDGKSFKTFNSSLKMEITDKNINPLECIIVRIRYISLDKQEEITINMDDFSWKISVCAEFQSIYQKQCTKFDELLS